MIYTYKTIHKIGSKTVPTLPVNKGVSYDLADVQRKVTIGKKKGGGDLRELQIRNFWVINKLNYTLLTRT